jgi:hypothetical protein
LTATEPPVGAQQEMKTKDFIFEVIQKTAAYQAKIRDKFFVFASPDRTPILAADDLEAHLAHAFFLLQTEPESGIAAPKYSSQNTITRCFRLLVACSGAQSISLA